MHISLKKIVEILEIRNFHKYLVKISSIKKPKESFALYCTVLYCTVMYYTILHCTKIGLKLAL